MDVTTFKSPLPALPTEKDIPPELQALWHAIHGTAPRHQLGDNWSKRTNQKAASN